MRSGFATHALHHAAVAAERKNIVIEDLEARTVEVLTHPFAGQRHSHAGGHALA